MKSAEILTFTQFPFYYKDFLDVSSGEKPTRAKPGDQNETARAHFCNRGYWPN
jgi:hypothetical protein